MNQIYKVIWSRVKQLLCGSFGNRRPLREKWGNSF